MNRNCVKGHSTPRRAMVLVAKNGLPGVVYADQLRQAVGCNAVDKCKVDQIVERGILIDTAAEWAPKTLSQLEIPHFGGGFCVQVQRVLTRAGIAALLSRWHLQNAVLTVIKHQDILIKSDRDGVLPNWWKAAGHESERILS